MNDLPKLLRDFPPPWYVTPDGIKTERGGMWVMTGRPDMLTQLCELANAFTPSKGEEAEPVGDRELRSLLETAAIALRPFALKPHPSYDDPGAPFKSYFSVAEILRAEEAHTKLLSALSKASSAPKEGEPV